MTDIYVGSRKPTWWWGIAVIVLLIVVGSWFLLRSPKEASIPDTSVPVSPSEAPQQSATPTPVPVVSKSTASLPSLEKIQNLIRTEQLHAARALAYERLEGLTELSQRHSTEILLGALNTRMVFEKIPMEEKIVHVVGRGDTLGKLAQTYGTTPELIGVSNGVDGNLIRLGETLRILQGTLTAVVDKTRNDMVVSLNGRFFKRYAVGTGTHSSTPVGDYKITLRMMHPVWYRPDGEEFPYGHPENLLGTHYLKLNTPGIGLHGTWQPETIGSQSSAGCVRLRNEMIEELYNLLPVGTSVRIENGF